MRASVGNDLVFERLFSQPLTARWVCPGSPLPWRCWMPSGAVCMRSSVCCGSSATGRHSPACRAMYRIESYRVFFCNIFYHAVQDLTFRSRSGKPAGDGMNFLCALNQPVLPEPPSLPASLNRGPSIL